jgi:4-amino-4-deoxy-L-arabinose transferase-like glycosyltransferase
MLAMVLFISKFNPVSGAYLTILFGLATVFLMYKLGSLMFSPRVGLIAATLYASSPLIIYFDRMPFDPSPIPFFTLLYLFSLFKWVKGELKYFSFAIFLIAILYNLELATFTLVFPFVLIILYGLVKHRSWLTGLINRRIAVISLAALLIPMFPVVVYDFSHGFKQTVVFLGWTIYKPLSSLIKHSSGNSGSNFGLVINFILTSLQKIIFQFNLEIAIVIFILSLAYLFYVNIKHFRVESSRFLLLFLLLVSLFGILVNQAPSDAYLPILFPFLMFLLALFFEKLLNKKILKYFVYLVIGLIVVVNGYSSIKNNYGYTLNQRLIAVNKIISLAKNHKYNLVGQGTNSQFQSFTMNYEYLLWWKRYPLSSIDQKVKIFVSEDDKGIHVTLKN